MASICDYVEVILQIRHAIATNNITHDTSKYAYLVHMRKNVTGIPALHIDLESIMKATRDNYKQLTRTLYEIKDPVKLAAVRNMLKATLRTKAALSFLTKTPKPAMSHVKPSSFASVLGLAAAAPAAGLGSGSGVARASGSGAAPASGSGAAPASGVAASGSGAASVNIAKRVSIIAKKHKKKKAYFTSKRHLLLNKQYVAAQRAMV